jgi:hypothetical protein
MGVNVTVENSVENAIKTVGHDYGRCGAQILVVGSTYQAGAVIIMLRDDQRKNEGESSSH